MRHYEDLDLNFVDGKWTEGTSEEVIEVPDPYTQEMLLTLQAASKDDVDTAYESAKKHQVKWAKTGPYEKVEIIRKAIRIVEDRKEEFSDWLVKEAVEEAKKDGAEILLEGKRDGNVLSPIIVKGTNDVATARDEMFGPVVTLIPAKDEEHALELANDTEQGLSAAVTSENEKRAFAFAERVESGMVHINDQSVNDEPYIAFGGEKESGVGRFGREHSLNEFTTWKWISVQEETREYPTD